jgi:tellurium resistance protein TerD
MANFNLTKGERFNLSKHDGGTLQKVKIEMGWKVNQDPNGPNFDLDVSAFMIGSEKDFNFKIVDDSCFVFYGSVYKEQAPDGLNRPYSLDKALYGAVDNQGDDDEEDNDGEATEDMLFDLSKVNKQVEQIIIAVTICKYPHDKDKDRRTLQLNYGMVQNCYIRILNTKNGEVILRYNLAEEFSNEDAVEFGRLYRMGNEWVFEALGRGSQGSLPGLIEQYT